MFTGDECTDYLKQQYDLHNRNRLYGTSFCYVRYTKNKSYITFKSLVRDIVMYTDGENTDYLRGQ